MSRREELFIVTLEHLVEVPTAEDALTLAYAYFKENQGYRAKDILYAIERFLLPDRGEDYERIRKMIGTLEAAQESIK